MSGGGVRVLVGTLVFKTSEAENLGLAGSIPVRLRHNFLGAITVGEKIAAFPCCPDHHRMKR